jgi:hypothetical protein
MAEAEGAIALYFAHVAAETLRPCLARGQRVLDFGDRAGNFAPHLRAAGVAVEREPTGMYDGAFAEVRDWDGARERARSLADRLRPGAPVLIRLERRPGQTVERVRQELGPAFSWERSSALGLLVPGEALSGWAESHPHAFAVLCALEGVLRSWPPFSRGGREALLLGRRRPGSRG